MLGGALYIGRWHKDARKLLKRRRRELASLPLAVFALGPKSTEPEALENAAAQLARALDAVPEVHSFSAAVFGSVIDPSKLGFPFKHMPAVDARDWNAIQDWAGDVARELAAQFGR